MRQLHLDMDHFLKERAALYVSERVLFPLSLFLTLSTPFFKFFCSPCLPDSEGLGSVTSSIENDISSDKVERRGLSFIASSFFLYRGGAEPPTRSGREPDHFAVARRGRAAQMHRNQRPRPFHRSR